MCTALHRRLTAKCLISSYQIAKLRNVAPERTRAVESIPNETNFATTLISTDSVDTHGILGALITISIDTFIDVLKTNRMQVFVKDTTLQNKYTTDSQKGILFSVGC